MELSASSVPMVAYREHKLAPFLDGIKEAPEKGLSFYLRPSLIFLVMYINCPFLVLSVLRVSTFPHQRRVNFSLSLPRLRMLHRLPDASPSAYTPSFFTTVCTIGARPILFRRICMSWSLKQRIVGEARGSTRDEQKATRKQTSSEKWPRRMPSS